MSSSQPSLLPGATRALADFAATTQFDDVPGDEQLLHVRLRDVQMRRDADRCPALADEHVLRTEGSDKISCEPLRQARANDVRTALR